MSVCDASVHVGLEDMTRAIRGDLYAVSEILVPKLLPEGALKRFFFPVTPWRLTLCLHPVVPQNGTELGNCPTAMPTRKIFLTGQQVGRLKTKNDQILAGGDRGACACAPPLTPTLRRLNSATCAVSPGWSAG